MTVDRREVALSRCAGRELEPSPHNELALSPVVPIPIRPSQAASVFRQGWSELGHQAAALLVSSEKSARQMNPLNSRATATFATVGFLPLSFTRCR